MVHHDLITVQGARGRHRACGFGSPLRCLADILFLFLFLFLLVLAVAPPRAIAANAVDITAVVGFTDTFRPGHWTPLTVTVTNRGDDLIGELEVRVAGDDALRGRQLTTSHRRNLELHRDSRKSLQFTVLPQGLSHPLVIVVRADGREVGRAEIDLRARFATERLLLVLGRNADLDYLNDRAGDGLRVLHPHPELLPVHWRGYDAVAAMLLHGVSLEQLSASQFDALHKWIAQGGILAVSGGPDYALLRTTRLAALLPGQPAGTTRVDAEALKAAFSATLDVSRPIHVNRLGAFRGRARLRAGEVPLIVERALGLGRVLYLSFDVAGHPFDRWEGMRALWLDSLRLPSPTPASRNVSDPVPESPLAALIRAEAANFPHYSTAFLFLALYLGLLLVGYTMPMRATRSRWLAPFWSWAAPVPFALTAWLLFGPAVFPRGATAAAVALIEPLPGSGYARLGLDLGVYANRSGTLRLDFRGAEPALYPHRQARREGKVGDWVLGEGPRPYIESLDRRRYVLHALEGDDVIAFQFEAAVHAEATGPRLVLDNASGRALGDSWLVFDGYAYELGSIAAGARVDRRLVPATHGIEVGEESWRRVLKPAPGGTGQTLAPARIMLERRSQAMGSDGYPGQGHALLIGYTGNPLQPAGASADWPRREQVLVALRMAALPGVASEGPTGTVPLERVEGETGRAKARRLPAAGAGATAPGNE